MNKVEECLDMINPDNAMSDSNFVKADVNISFSDDNSWTALHFACWNGNFKFVN